jgi:hypothetical protein
MNKTEIKDTILSEVSKEIDLWLDKSETIEDGYEYETEFIETARRVSKILFSKSLGDTSSNRNKKKKLQTCFGKIEINKNHVLCNHTSVFGITAKMQEIICLLAQNEVFEDAQETLLNLLGLAVSAKQIQRVSEHFGEKLEDLEKEYQEKEEEAPMVVPKDSQEIVYPMIDGSMVFTRENGWKEMKVGRIYSESSRVKIQRKRIEVMASVYICTFGSYKDFLKKFKPYLSQYKQKVFIADGAKWIWNWIEENYGADCVQILDFFHAVEKLSAFATLNYKDATKRRRWIELQKQRLKADEIESIIADLKNIVTKTKQAQNALQDVIRYYENNIKRMKYETFLQKGYLIGSGAIESAHRNVIQQRLKLSGQRWSISGAQQIANLRAYKKSNRWKTIVNQIKKAA